MFYIFIKACRKYEFGFSINTFGNAILTLTPYNTFENISITKGLRDYNFNKLFLKAIKEMKRYRKERG